MMLLQIGLVMGSWETPDQMWRFDFQSNGEVVIWHYYTGSHAALWPEDNEVAGVYQWSVSPDGQRLAICYGLPARSRNTVPWWPDRCRELVARLFVYATGVIQPSGVPWYERRLKIYYGGLQMMRFRFPAYPAGPRALYRCWPAAGDCG